MSKLKKAESKLGNLGAGGKKASGKKQPTPEGIVQGSASAKPTSFRLTAEDKANLAQLVAAVNGVSRSKVSSTRVVQALLQMGAEMSPERVLKAVRALL